MTCPGQSPSRCLFTNFVFYGINLSIFNKKNLIGCGISGLKSNFLPFAQKFGQYYCFERLKFSNNTTFTNKKHLETTLFLGYTITNNLVSSQCFKGMQLNDPMQIDDINRVK